MICRSLCAVITVLSAALALGAPDCLIVQVRQPVEGDTDTNFALTSFVADQLDKDGRVRPVVWSLTDPVFRTWTNRDVFGSFEPNPSQSHALDTARKLGVQYVLVVRGYREDQNMYAVADLFSNGRNVWRFGPRRPDKRNDIVIQTDGRYDEEATRAFQAKMPDLLKSGGTFTVYQGGVPDVVETARSVASTWAALLGDGPFKDLPPKPRLGDADQATGAGIDPADLQGPEGASSEDVVEVVKRLVEQGHYHRAMLLLREACDRDPYNSKARQALVETMIAAGMSREAAEAAQAATRLTPGESEVWITAARAWIRASDPEKTRENLDQALKLGAAPDVTAELEGEIALLNGDSRLALLKFKDSTSGRITLRKAIALALSGDSKGCVTTLASLGEGALTEDDYRTVVLFIERALLTVGDSSRSVLPTIRLHPGAPETLSQAKSLCDLANSLSELVSRIKPPQVHNESHESRKLAHILLAQAAMEALDFAHRNDPDVGEEAAATFSQAFKLLPGVREKFALERKYGSAH